MSDSDAAPEDAAEQILTRGMVWRCWRELYDAMVEKNRAPDYPLVWEGDQA